MKNQKFKTKRPVQGTGPQAEAFQQLMALLAAGPKTMTELETQMGRSADNLQTYLSRARRAGYMVETDRTAKPCVYRLALATVGSPAVAKKQTVQEAAFRLVAHAVSREQFDLVLAAFRIAESQEQNSEK